MRGEPYLVEVRKVALFLLESDLNLNIIELSTAFLSF